IPALGESQAEPHIAYQLVDVLGDAKRDYLNKSVLVVGSGYWAATTVSNLAKLAQDHNTTWITRATRTAQPAPLPRTANPPRRDHRPEDAGLLEADLSRPRLAAQSRTELLCAGREELWPQFVVLDAARLRAGARRVHADNQQRGAGFVQEMIDTRYNRRSIVH